VPRASSLQVRPEPGDPPPAEPSDWRGGRLCRRTRTARWGWKAPAALNALRDWAGDEAEIRELGLQFRVINHKHDVLRTTGVVTDKKQENGENLVMLDINVLNQKDEMTAPGRAVVVLLSRG